MPIPIQHWLVSESLCRRHLRGPPPGIMIVFITIRVTAAICPSPNLPRCDVRGGDEDVVAPFCHQLQFKYAQLMGTGEFKRRYPDKDGLTASSTATSQQNAILDHRAAALPSSAPSAYFSIPLLSLSCAHITLSLTIRQTSLSRASTSSISFLCAGQ